MTDTTLKDHKNKYLKKRSTNEGSKQGERSKEIKIKKNTITERRGREGEDN